MGRSCRSTQRADSRVCCMCESLGWFALNDLYCLILCLHLTMAIKVRREPMFKRGLGGIEGQTTETHIDLQLMASSKCQADPLR